MALSAHGLRYPTSTDNVNPPEDFQNLATDVDSKVWATPVCEVYKAGLQTIEEGGSGEEVEWDGVESFDTHGFHSGGNPFRIVPTVAGIYLVYFTLNWDAGNGGYRRGTIKKNGSAVAGGGSQIYSDTYTVTCTNQRMLSANGSGDYFSIEAYQNASGQSIDIFGGTGQFASLFGVQYIRPLP